MKKKLLLSFLVSLLATFFVVSCDQEEDDNTSLLAGALSMIQNQGQSDAAAEYEVSFASVAYPSTDAQKRAVTASETVTVDGKDYSLSYNTLLRSGATAGSGTFGALKDITGATVKDESGDDAISDSNDFTSLIYDQKDKTKIYMVNHFESRPGALYLSAVSQDASTGALTVTSTQNIDASDVNGIWVPCAGSITPWGTHMGSEEYEPDARSIEELAATDGVVDGNSYYAAMAAYFSGSYADLSAANNIGKGVANGTAMNPYYWGWTTEVSVSNGSPTVSKIYALGRKAHELSYTMPDKKTIYQTDDGTNVGLFMFVSDSEITSPHSVTAGTLYAMKWNQTSATGAGAADLEWVSLGAITTAQTNALKSAVNAGEILFSDIFSTTDRNADGSCPSGYSRSVANDTHECLKLKSGNLNAGGTEYNIPVELAASRLEARRYAAIKGATVELRKEEGFTFNVKLNKVFLAMSEVRSGMSDTDADDEYNWVENGEIVAFNDISVEKSDKCGTVYELNVNGTTAVTDTDGDAIDSDYIATDISAMVSGEEYADGDTSDEAVNNSCDVDNIASPDNVTTIQGTDIVIIGEDTGSHQNDVIWAYDYTAKTLTRIQTTPYGSETTSPYFIHSIDAANGKWGEGTGFGYLMSVIQHPYGESDEDQLTDGSGDDRGYTGYVGPFPAFEGVSGFQY